MKHNKSQPEDKKTSRAVIEVEKVFNDINSEEVVRVIEKMLPSVIDSMSDGRLNSAKCDTILLQRVD